MDGLWTKRSGWCEVGFNKLYICFTWGERETNNERALGGRSDEIKIHAKRT